MTDEEFVVWRCPECGKTAEAAAYTSLVVCSAHRKGVRMVKEEK